MKKTPFNILPNSFHIVIPSPWPILVSISLWRTAITLIYLIGSNTIRIKTFSITLIFLMRNAFIWWKDLIREASFQGFHTITTEKILKIRIILFITSEIILFIRLFWTFFHRRISPNIELGINWPPFGIIVFNPIGIPLLNSIILLSSGASITWSHHSFLSKKLKLSSVSIIITILLGFLFTIFQGIEYFNSQFTITDSIYGSTFFLATGFHGLHVIVGSLFLIVSRKSIISIINASNHFTIFDLRVWYWHFVDVVWLFLFSSMYWWGST